MKVEFLDNERIRMHLQPVGADLCRRINVFPTIGSTNDWLTERLRAGRAAGGDVCMAESQSAGRGRRGRSWVSQSTGNLYLSVAWTLMYPETAAASVTLAIGLGVAEALHSLSGVHIGLKWPNDLYVDERKVGGILVESVHGANAAHWVVGVGLNLVAPELPAETFPRAAGLVERWPEALRQRNALAGGIVDSVLTSCLRFEEHGLDDGVRERWEAHDLTRTRAVAVHRIDGSVLHGVGAGIDERGRLRVLGDGVDIWLDAGEVSLRLS